MYLRLKGIQVSVNRLFVFSFEKQLLFLTFINFGQFFSDFVFFFALFTLFSQVLLTHTSRKASHVSLILLLFPCELNFDFACPFTFCSDIEC